MTERQQNARIQAIRDRELDDATSGDGESYDMESNGQEFWEPNNAN
jgi:hypothetical protein